MGWLRCPCRVDRLAHNNSVKRIYSSPTHTLLVAIVSVIALAGLCSVAIAQTIRDNQPAEEWTDAYPVGNGRLGAMPFGQFPTEKLLLNEETIWHRGPDQFMPEDSRRHLEAVRELEAAGSYAEADAYFEEHIMAGVDPYSYQFLGWLEIEYLTDDSASETHRRLDLDTGVAETRHRLNDGSEVLEQVWVSAPEDCIVVRITADKPVGLRIKLDGGQTSGTDLVKIGSGTGEHPNVVQFEGRVRVLESAMANENALVAPARESHTVVISAATKFDREHSDQMLADGWQDKARRDLDRASETPVEDLLRDAVADHQHYFRRLSLDLGTTDEEIARLTTPQRLARIQEGHADDPDLIETYFQFGRYLLIASSRPGTLPSNLQGIWNPHLQAPWSSDYHLNINIQMNYWPVETANLSELHEPFIDLIRYFQPRGRDMARRLGMAGWCMGHATDVWANARIMSSRAYWGGTFFGGQWMTFHILDHYRFTRDSKVLADNWDILTASAQFVESWLIPGPEEGQLMARPSASPENSFLYVDADGETREAALAAGNSFDQYMILQVFSDYLEAAEVLGKQDDAFVQKVAATLPRVYRPQIGPDGRLMEWRLPFGEKEPGHRHISHVLGAYPGNQINLDTDPEMRSAVEKTIEYRLENGGAYTGWSRAWTIGMFARLSNGEEACSNLIEILRRSTAGSLLDMHPPFQIDGNFGATAAIAEMLLHSHNHEIRFLPALPEAWPTGSISGIRARGDFTLSFAWQEHRLTKLQITFGPNSPEHATLRYGGSTLQVSGRPGSIQTLDASRFAVADQR